ncbi:MAG: hypothetical protein LWX11_09400 [Firmicutes bacterium]|nr:hypothetical protein [Bacillota bacterium]
METSVALGIVGLLSALGVGLACPTGAELAGLQVELPGAIHQAKVLARASGHNVIVALGDPTKGPDVLPVHLPSKVKWGKPAHIPLPKGMADPKVADDTGEAHAKVTLTPRNTATATTWFLNDGREALCMRLSGQGRLQLLRWRKDQKTWVKVG